MKKIFILLNTILMTGCMSMYTGLGTGTSNLYAGWGYYTYKYEMEGINPDSVMVFNDSLINVTFNISKEGIGFKMQNKLNKPLRIIWDETSYINNNKAGKVMHVGVKYTERSNSQPPTLIPPGTIIDDEITPVENIRWRSGTTYSAGGWVTDPLFPGTDAGSEDIKTGILAFKGQTFSIYMPIQRGNNTLNYHWKFKIADVIPIKK